ncbi:MAG: CHAT domain-containing protein [Candidatus Acidiferrales bacterium]
MYDQAWSYLNRGELNRALDLVDSRLRIVSPPEGYWYWKLIALKAEILLRERRTKDALVLLQPDLPAGLAGSDVDLWRKMTLGIANAYTLNYAQSKKLLDDAEILAKAKHPEFLGEVVLREGTLALTKSEYEVASSQYRIALQLAKDEKNPFLEAASLGSLGLVAARQEHYDESIEWNRRALERAVTIDAKSSVARILGNLGWSYREMGDYERALDLLGQARVAAEQAGTVRLQIDALINSGNVYHQQHNYELAKSSFQSALAIATSVSDEAAMALCFENLSRLGLATGDLEFAQKNEEQLASFISRHPDHSLELYSLLDKGSLEQARGRYKESEPLFRRVIDDNASTAPEKWEAQERLAESYSVENRARDAEYEYRQALQTIAKARSSLGAEELRISFLSTPIEVYDSYIEFLLKHSRSREALQIAELSRARTLEDGLGAGTRRSSSILQTVAPESIARRLRSTLLFYWLGQNHSYLWVISPAKTTCFVLPKSAEVAPLVKAYRQQIVDLEDVLSGKSTAGAQLYSMLVQRASKLIPKGSRVILLPAESLYGLNFESLIVPDPKPHFWIEDVILTTGSSLTLLASASPQVPAKSKNLLLVGNAESPNTDFPPLAQAPAEMAKVAGYFPQVEREILEGNRATPSAYLRSNPERFSYLHFVTHGTASHTRPLESAVILSKEGDSYKLYARDIVAHPLKAQLVTISACNGAGTRAYAGEGLVGLSWAFLRAGAHNVIASLWEVSDASSTPQLMDALYEGLTHGEDPAIALRNAKLFILKSNAHTVFAKPFYWAPFQLYAGS